MKTDLRVENGFCEKHNDVDVLGIDVIIVGVLRMNIILVILRVYERYEKATIYMAVVRKAVIYFGLCEEGCHLLWTL